MTLRTFNSVFKSIVSYVGLVLSFTTLLWGQEQQSWYTAVVGQDSFVASGYNIYRKSAGRWVIAGGFAVPTVSMLQQNRPQVGDDFGNSDNSTSLFSLVEDVSSTIDTMIAADGRLWFGFGFYEGEGWEGYGGIGFFDPSTNRIGVLRHPALVDYSVKAILITDTVLYVQTVGNYEGASSVGNGLVGVDRRSLNVTALVPPGTATLWDKDDTASAGPMYNKPIAEILRDKRLIRKAVPQFSPTLIDCVQAVGLDSFMIRSAREEWAVRERAAADATLARDVLRLPREDGGWVSQGAMTGVRLEAGTLSSLSPVCTITGVAYFSIQVTEALSFSENFGIRPARVYPGFIDNDNRPRIAEQGDSWIRETSKTRVTFILDSLGTHEQSCVVNGQVVSFQYFNPVTVRVEVRQLHERY